MAALAVLALATSAAARRPDGRLEIEIVEAATGQPVAARVHLRDGRGRPVVPGRAPEPWGAASLGDHAYVDGAATLGLARGAYRFDLDPGPEFRTQHGAFEIVRHAEDAKRVEVARFADLANEGWSAADLATCRPAADYPLLRRAEQLDHAPAVAVAWRDGAWRDPKLAAARRHDAPGATALWDDPRGVVWLIDPAGALDPVDLPEPGPSSVAFLRAARERGWRVVAAIASRELSLWVPHGVVDAVVVVDGWIDSPAGEAAHRRSRTPTRLRFPGPQGPGRWRRALYESLVEAGVRLPPVALSGSGLNLDPIGSSRVYAAVDRQRGPAAWWEAADQLAVVVTSGPLLRPSVEGAPPGETFLLPPGGERTLSVALNLGTRTPVEYLELVKDGRVLHSVRLADFAASGGRLPAVTFDAPGWLSVVAVAESADRYEVAMSAPWFVEGATGGRISDAARVAWLEALSAARRDFGEGDPASYDEAQRFWETRESP